MDNNDDNHRKSVLTAHRPCREPEGAAEEEEISVWEEKRITITVEKFENFDHTKVKAIVIQIKLQDDILIESPPVVLDENGCAEVEISTEINLKEPDPRTFDNLLANPILFTVMETAHKTENNPKSSPSSKSAKSEIPSRSNILGYCNMDLGPLLMGQKLIRDYLVIENGKTSKGHEVIAWPNLPRMVVSAATEDEEILESANKFNNVMGITVESVYNIPKSIPEGTIFDALFMLPCFNDKMETIAFANGITTAAKDCEGLKQWLTLPNIEGRGRLAKSKIIHESSDVYNPYKPEINLDKIFHNGSIRIVWNKWRRCFLSKTGFNIFFDKISKYRVWPIEVVATTKTSAIGKNGKADRKTKPSTSITGSNPQRYIAFLDLSPLLYPGTTRARIVGHLHTYSVTDLIEKWGLEHCPPNGQPRTPSQLLKSKTAIEKSRMSASKEVEELKEEPGVPIYDEEGNPVFIIIEIEIWKPYIPKKSPEFLHESLLAYIPPKGKATRKMMTLALAEENFTQIISAFTSIIKEEYQNFSTSIKDEEFLSDNLEIYFYDHLCHTANFQKIKSTCENKVLDLVGEKFGSLKDCKEILPEIYVNLLEKIHKIINDSAVGEDCKSFHVDMDQLQLFAEEAIEENNYELAKKYLLQKTIKFKCNPDYWLDYAVFHLKIQQVDKAIELIREGLSWDISHELGLLLYGLSMANIGEYCIAELVLLTLLSKYPNFIEGWVVANLFYLKIENYEGAQVSLQTAAKLNCKQKLMTQSSNGDCESSNEKSSTCTINSTTFEESHKLIADGRYGLASYIKGVSLSDPLSWTTTLCPENSLYIKTAVLLMKFSFFEFVEMALAQELLLENCGRSLPYLYYMAVSFYLRGRYHEAISHLEEAVKDYGKDCSLWGLMGHCYHKLKDFSNSISCYEYVIESFNRPDDIYLIYLRMSNYYLETKKFNCAKKISICACKYKSTPSIWRAIGISTYRLMEFEEAEAALTEANFLDSFCPVTWGYLALVNIQLKRYDISQQCYLEAKKRNLQDQDLIDEIEKSRQMNGCKEAD